MTAEGARIARMCAGARRTVNLRLHDLHKRSGRFPMVLVRLMPLRIV